MRSRTDWLVDRKIVPQAWSKSYTDVRNRFPAALQEIADIPELKALNLTTDSTEPRIECHHRAL